MPIKGITELLPELRAERGWSRERLSHQAFQIDPDGTSVAQISAIERGVRRASARTILTLAKALEVPPEQFPEFRLAVARMELDERIFGLERAIERLEACEFEPTSLTEQDIQEISSRSKAPEQALRQAKGVRGRAKGGR